MITIKITDEARRQFLEFLAAEAKETNKEVAGLAIMLTVGGQGPQGFRYGLDFIEETAARADADQYLELDYDDFRMFVDTDSTGVLDGVEIDFVQRGLESGFHFENPNSRWDDPLTQRVQDVIDTQINPSVASHGGFITLLEVKDQTAFIALGGGCQGCGMADVTLKQGIEIAIKEAVPEIRAVLDSTDHAAGENPYYQPAKGGDSPFAI